MSGKLLGGNRTGFTRGKLEQQIPDDSDVLCLKRLGGKVAALEMLKQELQARNRLLESLEVRRASSTSSTGQSGSQDWDDSSGMVEFSSSLAASAQPAPHWGSKTLSGTGMTGPTSAGALQESTRDGSRRVSKCAQIRSTASTRHGSEDDHQGRKMKTGCPANTSGPASLGAAAAAAAAKAGSNSAAAAAAARGKPAGRLPFQDPMLRPLSHRSRCGSGGGRSLAAAGALSCSQGNF